MRSLAVEPSSAASSSATPWAGRLRGLHVPADLARQLRPVQEAAQLREVEVLGPEAHEEGADRLGARPHQAR